MKKILLSFALLILASTAFAQLNYGVKFGFNGAMGGYGSGLTMRANYYVGAHFEIDIDEKYSIQPELVYSREGSVEHVGSSERKSTLHLDYINIPIIAKYYINGEWSVDAGPQVGVKINAQSIEHDGFREEDPVNVWDKYTLFGLSMCVGSTYNFTDVFAVSLRYNIGLIDLDKGDFDNDKLHSNVLQVGLDFTF